MKKHTKKHVERRNRPAQAFVAESTSRTSLKAAGRRSDAMGAPDVTLSQSPTRWVWLDVAASVLGVNEGHLRRRCNQYWKAAGLARKSRRESTGQTAWQISEQADSSLAAADISHINPSAPAALEGRPARSLSNTEVQQMGKSPNPGDGARRASSKRRERPTLPPVHRSTLPLALDAGNGIIWHLTFAESPDMNGSHVLCDHEERTVKVRATDDARELLRRIGFAISEIAEDAGKVLADRQRRDLCVELEQLAKFIEIGTPTRSAVRRAFQIAGYLGEAVEGYLASDEQLRLARDLFYKLPPFEQREILNGWLPQPERPAPEVVSEVHEEIEARRVLTLGTRCDRVSYRHEFITQVGSYYDPVCVVIQEGTSKADALQCLEDVTRALLDAWPLLIDGGPSGMRTASEMAAYDILYRDAPGVIVGRAESAPNDLTLPARVMFDGTTPQQPLFKLLSTSTRSGVGTQIVTDESIDKNGQPVRVGDMIVESDGSVLSTKGGEGAGLVLAVAGSAVIYSFGRGKGYATAQASECYVVSANEKGETSKTPNPLKPASNERDEARAATPAQ